MTDTQHRIINAIAVPAGLYSAYNSLRKGRRVTALYQLTGVCLCAYMALTGRR